eukprot:10063.XXX_565242_565397_1 [CDS] Oithona nana genome sequencing.
MICHGMANKLFTSRKAPFTFRTTVVNTCEVFYAFNSPRIEISLRFDFQIHL